MQERFIQCDNYILSNAFKFYHELYFTKYNQGREFFMRHWNEAVMVQKYRYADNLTTLLKIQKAVADSATD